MADGRWPMTDSRKPEAGSRKPEAGSRELSADTNRALVNRLQTYLSFVRFSHSVFALPFALTGALLALHERPLPPREIGWRVLWIVVAMVAARSAAMGFNRLADAEWDAKNPRTAMREIPRGAMTRTEAA